MPEAWQVPLRWAYNDVWAHAGGHFSGMDDPTGVDGNLSVDPLFQDPDADNYDLLAVSQCVDAGDPDLLDADGTRSDMGAYGGPEGDWP